MENGKMIGIGLGTVAGIAIVYFGFIKKNANGLTAWQKMMDPTKQGRDVPPRKALTADEATEAVKVGADGVAIKSKYSSVGGARMKAGTKAVIGNEVCEWDGSNWVNCKPLKKTSASL